MRHDLLYTLFEQHLFNALVENETSDAFLKRVVGEYLLLLQTRGTIALEHREIIEADLKEEVLEMLRKKTYGHYNLEAFRKATQKAAEADLAKSSRPRRES